LVEVVILYSLLESLFTFFVLIYSFHFSFTRSWMSWCLCSSLNWMLMIQLLVTCYKYSLLTTCFHQLGYNSFFPSS